MTNDTTRPATCGPAASGPDEGTIPGRPTTSPLRAALDVEITKAAAAGSKLTMKDITVLAPQNDPFRVDTPARHRDGEWLATTAGELGLGDRKIHLRGLHYMVIGRPKPDGTPYTNTDDDWTWLQSDAAKAARWLGYIPFDQIIDQRNSEPTIIPFEQPEPLPYVTVDFDVEIPDADSLLPKVDAAGFRGVQPYRLVMVGEKSSLEEVLAPIASSYKADLYLPTGEPSDTMLYRMAQAAAEDGRPMVVLYFSDCDPAGWQMPISVARKLQAFKALAFNDIEFEVRRVALTPDQVREYGLPSTPLKDTEKRADRWQRETGVEQTEIDALAALRPDLLRRIANDAVRPFFDATLDHRVWQAYAAWLTAAQQAVDEQVDGDIRGRIHAEAASQLAQVEAQIEEIKNSMRLDASEFSVPPIVVPQPTLSRESGTPLIDSRSPFAEQCRRLIASKNYQPEAAR
jgi:hypothetical protein